MPELPALLRANRSFLRRAVRFLVGAGIRQFLDLGSGIPTVGNVHSIAEAANPECRVAYVDIDPVAVAHSRLMLRNNPRAVAVQADLRDPDTVLENPTVTGLLDFSRPIALLAVAVLHFVPDVDRPADILAHYIRALPADSYVVLSHATVGNENPDQVQEAADLYASSIPGFTLRGRDQVAGFVAGLDLVEPGLVYLGNWRPDPTETDTEPSTLPGYGAVGIKRAAQTSTLADS